VPALAQPEASDVSGLAASAVVDTTNAGNIGSGTLSAARLPSTAVLSNRVNNYTNVNAPTPPNTGSVSVWTDSTNKNLEAISSTGALSVTVQPVSPIAHRFATGIAANGSVTLTQPAAADISGLANSAIVDATVASNITSGTLPAGRLPNPTSSTLGGVQSITPGSHQFLTAISTNGIPSAAQPAPADIGGSLSTDLSGTLAAPVVAKIHGTTVPTNSSADQVLVTNAPAAAQWISFPNCSDNAGSHLNYDTTTHQLSCGSTTGGSASTAWSTLTSGVNTQGNFAIGNNATLAPQGTGIITANAFSGTLQSGNLPSSVIQTSQVNSYTNQPQPGTPIPGNTNVWTDINDKNLKAKNDAGIISVTVQPTIAAPHKFVAAIGSDGSVTQLQPDASDLTGLANSAVVDTTNAANISVGTLPAARLPLPSPTTAGGVRSAAAATHQWIDSISTTGVPHLSQPAAADIFGLAPSATVDTTNASNITTGTINTFLLPFSVVQSNQVTTYFNQAAPLSTPVAGQTYGWIDSTDKNFEVKNDAGTLAVTVQPTAAVSHRFVTAIASNGAVSQAQPSASDITGLAASATTDATNASNIATGTLSSSRLPATIGAATTGNAATASALAALPTACAGGQYATGVAANGNAICSNISASGVVDTTNASNITSGTLAAARLPNPTASTLGGVQSLAAVSHQFLDSISTSGVPHASQPIAADIGGLAASATTDTTNASNIASGTLSSSRLPGSIAANTTGNAATATALASAPTACTAGQFATAVDVNGNAICSTPTAYTLPPATGSTLGGVTVGPTSGLTISSGALAASFGTSANDVVQGNDVRVVNAVETTSSYSDPSWLTALAGSKLTGTVPVGTMPTGIPVTSIGDASNNATTWSYLNGLTGQIQGQINAINASGGPSGNFTFPYTGSNALTSTNFLSGPYVDIRSFGATTASTDNSAAINAAIAAAVATSTGKVFVPAGVWKTAAVIQDLNKVKIVGVGRGDSTANSVIQATASFPSSTAVIRIGADASHPVFGGGVEDITIDCNSQSGCGGILNYFGEEQTQIKRVTVLNAPGYCYMVAGAMDTASGHSQNSGPDEALECLPSAAAVTGTRDVILQNTLGYRGIIGASLSNGGFTTKPAYCLEASGQNTTLIGIHMEQCASGMLLAKSGTQGMQDLTVVNSDLGTGGTGASIEIDQNVTNATQGINLLGIRGLGIKDCVTFNCAGSVTNSVSHMYALGSNASGFTPVFSTDSADISHLKAQATEILNTGSSSNKDLAGALTLTAGSVTYTFAGTYAHAPTCRADSRTANRAYVSAISTTAFTVTGTGTDAVDYICIGHD
jgi:hypothetical protein